MDFHHVMMLIHHKLYGSYKLYYTIITYRAPSELTNTDIFLLDNVPNLPDIRNLVHPTSGWQCWKRLRRGCLGAKQPAPLPSSFLPPVPWAPPPAASECRPGSMGQEYRGIECLFRHWMKIYFQSLEESVTFCKNTLWINTLWNKYLSLQIFEHLNLHTHFRVSKPSYTF